MEYEKHMNETEGEAGRGTEGGFADHSDCDVSRFQYCSDFNQHFALFFDGSGVIDRGNDVFYPGSRDVDVSDG